MARVILSVIGYAVVSVAPSLVAAQRSTPAPAWGAPLWQFQTGGAVRAGPISFLVNGKQHVAIAAGHAIFVFVLDGA